MPHGVSCLKVTKHFRLILKCHRVMQVIMKIMKLASDWDLSFEKLSLWCTKKAEELPAVKTKIALVGSRKKEWGSTQFHCHVPDTKASFTAIQQMNWVNMIPL